MRSFSDSDEKAPPVLSKKPALPPASKKPQLRTGAPSAVPVQTTPMAASKKGSTEVVDSPEQRLNDLVDGTGISKLKITNNMAGGKVDHRRNLRMLDYGIYNLITLRTQFNICFSRY